MEAGFYRLDAHQTIGVKILKGTPALMPTQ